MYLIEKLYYYSHQYWDDIGDPRVNNFLVIRGGLWKILSIIGIYLLLTIHILPVYMKNRKPFNLEKVLFLYNIAMICMNIYGMYWSAVSLEYGTILLNFNYPSREDYSPRTLWLLTLGWVYMMSRICEFFDTIFFVLRKKAEQITSLHLYHHSMVPIVCWLSFKHNGMAPIIRLFLFLNTSLHAITYSYFALSAVRPELKTQFWLKKMLIKLEILQFVILGAYGLILYFKQTGYPMLWFVLTIGQTPLFFCLFCSFYQKKNKNKNSVKD